MPEVVFPVAGRARGVSGTMLASFRFDIRVFASAIKLIFDFFPTKIAMVHRHLDCHFVSEPKGLGGVADDGLEKVITLAVKGQDSVIDGLAA